MSGDEVALLVITDGRVELLEQALASAASHLQPYPTARYLFDDSGMPAYRDSLARAHPDFVHLNGGPRQGFGGAIISAWAQLRERTDARWIFHLEDDFMFAQPVDLPAMIEVLSANPHLAQMALRRQPVNADEHAAGGIIEQHPDSYVPYSMTRSDGQGYHAWLEHVRFFTTNPSLYRADLCDAGWPQGRQSEGRMMFRLREAGLPWGVPGEAVRFGYWGTRHEDPRCWHIGAARVGTGY